MASSAADARSGRSSRWLRSRWLRRLLVALAIVVAVVFAVRLALDPIAAHYLRKSLKRSPDMDGDFASVHVDVVPPGLQIRRLKLVPTGGDWRRPLLYVENAHFRLGLRDLLGGHLVARLRVDDPKLIMPQPTQGKPLPPLTSISPRRLVEQFPAVRVDRIGVKGGELLYQEPGQGPSGQLWIHDVDLAVENLATRPGLAGQRPIILTARAQVARSGVATLFVTADPFAKRITFSGRSQLRGLELSELHDFIAPKTDLQVAKGTLDMFAEFTCTNGILRGGVKPLLKNVEVKAADNSWVARLKAWAADETVDVASDRVEARNAVATVVPIRGNLDKPDLQLVPAVLGVLRNAFVIGLADSFARLPPGTAAQKQDLLQQVKEALSPRKNAPKAQPQGDRNGKRNERRRLKE
jgi:hypothetical protein